MAVDGSGNVYIADSNNNVVEKVTPAGTLSVIAGTGSSGLPTPGPSTLSELEQPDGVAVDGSGNVYIADTDNNDVEEAFPTHVTSTSVSCSPTSVLVGGTVSCTATVRDSAPAGVSTPSGSVSFTASPSSFGASSCTLAASESTGVASCQVSFAPSASGSFTVTGAYGGDVSHSASDAQSAALTATSPPPASPPAPTSDPTSTIVVCFPQTTAVGGHVTCVATVRDTAASGALTPTGTVSFSRSPASGSLSATSCTLAGTGTVGVASCQVTFTPSTGGTYTVTGSYGGDSRHLASSGQQGSLIASGQGQTRVGHPVVSHSTVSVPLRCSGGGACKVTLTLTVIETIKRGKVIAVAAASKKTKKTKKTVVLATAKVTIPAGKTKTVKITLNRTGKHLLSTHRTLKIRLAIVQSAHTVTRLTVTFKAARKPHRRG